MVLLVAFAVIGQFVASSIGAAMRSTVTWRSATALDSIGGALVSVVSFLLIAWVVGSVLNGSPFPLVDGQVNNSLVLQTVDRFVPSPARTMFSDFRRLLATNSTYSEVFSKIGAERIVDIPAPDSSVLDSRGYLAARASVVRIHGIAPTCSLSIEGSGFVISPDHILTNAHVVAGVTEHQIVTTASGQIHNATVVLYDPQVDIAVLGTSPTSTCPRFAVRRASTNPSDNAIVAGYPLDSQTLNAVAARIGGIPGRAGPGTSTRTAR